MLDFALTRLASGAATQLLWLGAEHALGKAVSCAELCKKQCPQPLHQTTRLFHRVAHQVYEPKRAGLERLRVTRELPCVAVLLSTKPLPAVGGAAVQAAGFDFASLWHRRVIGAPQERAAAAAVHGAGRGTGGKRVRGASEKTRVKRHQPPRPPGASAAPAFTADAAVSGGTEENVAGVVDPGPLSRVCLRQQ